MKRVQFFKEPVTSFCFALRLVNSVHFVCQNKAQNKMNGTKEPASELRIDYNSFRFGWAAKPEMESFCTICNASKKIINAIAIAL